MMFEPVLNNIFYSNQLCRYNYIKEHEGLSTFAKKSNFKF